MDLVTQNLLTSFTKDESLSADLTESVLFEHFVNFVAISNEYGDDFDVEAIHTGGGGDLGIDGIAILVNGTLVLAKDEVDDLAKINKYLEVDFIFCQAKSGGDFGGSEISNFFFGVKEFFSIKPTLPRNIAISQQESLVRHIYSNSVLFKRGNPTIRMYYATTGKWCDDTHLVNRIEHEKGILLEQEIFQEVYFNPVGARELQRLYTSAKNRLSKSIEFKNKITLPTLPGIQESYLGYLPAPEFIKLITDASGNIVRGLFYDNVRDFQGSNPVNHEMDETLKSPAQQFFVLMNNGVTIVADSISKTGDNFTIEDYQIVNGCQTSHVLYNNLKTLNSDVNIPVKLIVSQDGEVKNRIIKATNRQTPVKTEELTALTDFQKALEDYYTAITGDCRLFYERRSQQYRATAGIEKIRIVSVSSQIRSFSSVFLGLPHQASRYYGTLLSSIESKIFVPDHPAVAYYASALALYRFEALLRRKQISDKYRPFKYHLIAIVRIQIGGSSMPAMASNKFAKYCERIVDVLKDEKKYVASFQSAISVLDDVLDGDYSRDRAKDVTLLSHAEAKCRGDSGQTSSLGATRNNSSQPSLFD
jgi:AIPR protein